MDGVGSRRAAEKEAHQLSGGFSLGGDPIAIKFPNGQSEDEFIAANSSKTGQEVIDILSPLNPGFNFKVNCFIEQYPLVFSDSFVRVMTSFDGKFQNLARQ
eukprot:TRINITY_DN4451_c7_g1_i1.p1 TRINITY_DN4451_c7_g1~~TRINITY_DN4451_c7_g1_i1.p1  ORF type:complete len:108 (-),score=14.09 TRINITY_DN4451_c7_g1_i1:111-413(-)